MSDVFIIPLQIQSYLWYVNTTATTEKLVSTLGGSEFVFYVLHWEQNGFKEIIYSTLDIWLMPVFQNFIMGPLQIFS